MGRKKKTYLDLFLDNSENKDREKKKYNFREKQEDAILTYNNPETGENERNKLFKDVISPGFEGIVKGVLEMKMFHRLPKSMDREQLIEETYYRLIEKIHKFLPDLKGKTGEPVKAFSYFSTIAKHFIIEKIIRHKKILLNRADVETSIDLSILSEDTLKMMSNYDKMDISFDDPNGSFMMSKELVISTLREVISTEEAKSKPDKDFIRIGYTLIYLMEHWDKIEFGKRSEFMRILTLYTGLKQQRVSFQFKKFKTAIFKKLKPYGNKYMKNTKEIEEEDLIEDTDEEDIDIEDTSLGYDINSMEEFEMLQEKEYNNKIKEGRLSRKKVKSVPDLST